MLSGLSYFQIGVCFSDLNFKRTAEFKASIVKFPDLTGNIRNKKFWLVKISKQEWRQKNFIIHLQYMEYVVLRVCLAKL